MLLGRGSLMELNPIASFVVRISIADYHDNTDQKRWRIKVTYVQQETETLFNSMEEATEYMKKIAGV
jgi:hypothetical protein